MKHSSKYLYWSEVQEAWSAGKSLLIFHHYGRPSGGRSLFDEKLALNLLELPRVEAAIGMVTANVLFLFVGQPEATERSELAIALIEARWTPAVKVKRWRQTR